MIGDTFLGATSPFVSSLLMEHAQHMMLYLAAVIALRTILNFFLQMEIERSAPKKCPDTPVVAEHRKDA